MSHLQLLSNLQDNITILAVVFQTMDDSFVQLKILFSKIFLSLPSLVLAGLEATQ